MVPLLIGKEQDQGDHQEIKPGTLHPPDQPALQCRKETAEQREDEQEKKFIEISQDRKRMGVHCTRPPIHATLRQG